MGAIALVFLLRSCGQKETLPPSAVMEPPAVLPSTAVAVVPLASSTQAVVAPSAKPSRTPQPIKKAVVPAPAPLEPPKIEIHKELIPKNIEIIRVYYAAMITGPGSSLEFDINGSGFTKEFEKMITVESGQPEAVVKNLALITPNQIHGRLEVSPKSATQVAFPRVLIQGKTVFQAPEPFAVIRPGEVLNVIFTEMGESGRSGRFRVFTNLDQEMFQNFRVAVSTPAIQVSDLAPALPFVVDGTITIGPAVGGEYGLSVFLKDKAVWDKPGIIRVVRPNVGQSGLVQKVVPRDGFYRPGDVARFSIQGSGFLPPDVDIVKVSVKGLEGISSKLIYGSPGRLELEITLPPQAPVNKYGITLSAGAEVLQDLPDMFRVVDVNWTRGLALNPILKPGEKSTLSLLGRDLSSDYVETIKVEVDEPELTVGSFTLVSPQEATAPISAGASVKPGDYWIKLTRDGKPVLPEFGSIIKVSQ